MHASRAHDRRAGLTRRAEHPFPGSIRSGALCLVLVTSLLMIWAAFMARPISDEHPLTTATRADLRSVAYVVPGDSVDWIYSQPLAGGDARPLVAFPVPFGVHLRGLVSPGGDLIAVLRVASAAAGGQLTLVSASDGATRDVSGAFAYTSQLAWSHAGDKVAVVRDDGRTVAEVIVAPQPGQASTGDHFVLSAGTFPGALEVVPVGYSLDDAGLFIVVLDLDGSTLWRSAGGGLSKVGLLSTGPTLHWALSPGGDRLAYIDRLGVGGERTFAGRTFVIATREVIKAAGSSDQLGAVWRPGAGTPDFGGPGGSLRLDDGGAGLSVVPLAWSGDGLALIASVAPEGREGEAARVEILHDEYRRPLALEPGIQFLGIIRDYE